MPASVFDAHFDLMAHRGSKSVHRKPLSGFWGGLFQ
jgi:hypothetical protein